MRGRTGQPRVRLDPRALWDHLTRRNMSQNELARVAELSPGYLSELVAGNKSPQAATRRKLLAALGGLAFDDLFIMVDCDET